MRLNGTRYISENIQFILLQIEEGYTREALEAEEREKELRNKLILAEEKLLHSATAVENARYVLNRILRVSYSRHSHIGSYDDNDYSITIVQVRD